jgi:type III secretion translocon protein HrpF
MQVSNYNRATPMPLGGDAPPGEGLKQPLPTTQQIVVHNGGVSWGAADPGSKNPPSDLKQNAGEPSQTLQSLLGAIKSLLGRLEGQPGDGAKPTSSTLLLTSNMMGAKQPQAFDNASLLPSNIKTYTGKAEGNTPPPAYDKASPPYDTDSPPAYDGTDSAVSKGQDAPMSFAEMVTTLGRHEALLKKPLDFKGLEELAKDPKTPTDARRALEALVKDGVDGPMFKQFDAAKTGSTDGKISSKDVRELQKLPDVAAYADIKAESYTHDYVPSDAKPGSPPREMTTNDAMRELFQYSESLPGKNIDLKTLQKIANGTQDMGKCPPQVAAAAKFFADHPDQWQALTKDDGGKVSRDRLCDLAAANVNLSPQESKAIATLQNNKDIFFKGGGLKPGELKDIANDEKNSKEVRDAANLLAQPHSMLFSMLDNGKHGAGGNFFNKANDKNISEGDLNAFVKKGTNIVAQPPILSAPPTTKLEQDANKDMDIGQETQPDDKKEKGGGIFKMIEALSWIGTAVATVFTGGAAGALITAGRVIGTTVAKVVAREVGKEAVEQGAKHAAREAAKKEIKDSVKDAGKEVGKDFAKDVAKGSTKNAAKDYTQEEIDRIQRDDASIDAPRVWAQT